MTAWGTAHIHFSACNIILMTFAILCLLRKVKHVWVYGGDTAWEHKVVLTVGAACCVLPSRAKLSQSLTAVVLLAGVDFQLQIKKEPWVLKPPDFSRYDVFILWPTFCLAWMHIIDWNKSKLPNKYCPSSSSQSLESLCRCGCSIRHILPHWHSFDNQYCWWNCEILIYSKATRTYFISKCKQTSFGKGHGEADKSTKMEAALQGPGFPVPHNPLLLNTHYIQTSSESCRKDSCKHLIGETVLLLNHIFRYNKWNVNFNSKKGNSSKVFVIQRVELGFLNISFLDDEFYFYIS